MAVIGRFFESFRRENEAFPVGRGDADLGAELIEPLPDSRTVT
jgi:hypothetical protein